MNSQEYNMNNIKLENYKYYPALRTRASEIQGLKQLSIENKKKIIPLITLGKWPRSEDIRISVDKTLDAMDGNPFIIDVTQENKHHCDTSLNLLSPDNGFKNWLEFCDSYENVIPTIQIPQSAKLRDIVIQAKLLERLHRLVAFRIRNLTTDINKVISCLASLDNPENAIVFIDLNYIRGNFPAATAAAINAINQLRTEIPETIISVLTTSFPSSVTSFCDESGQRGFIDLMERDFYQSIGGQSVSIYGDHSSIHSVVYDDSMGRYVPRIDIALDDAWYFERRPGYDSKGYVEAAKEILNKFPNYHNEQTWGAQMIRNAANGNTDRMGSPSKWIAVRVNLHLSKQIESSEIIYNDEDEELEF